jgi:hypothetical protein
VAENDDHILLEPGASGINWIQGCVEVQTDAKIWSSFSATRVERESVWLRMQLIAEELAPSARDWLRLIGLQRNHPLQVVGVS